MKKQKYYTHYSLTELHRYLKEQNLEFTFDYPSDKIDANHHRTVVARINLSDGRFALGASDSRKQARKSAQRQLAKQLGIGLNFYGFAEATNADPTDPRIYQHYSISNLYSYAESNELKITYSNICNVMLSNGQRFAIVEASLSNGLRAIDSSDSIRKANKNTNRALAKKADIPPIYYLGTEVSPFPILQ